LIVGYTLHNFPLDVGFFPLPDLPSRGASFPWWIEEGVHVSLEGEKIGEKWWRSSRMLISGEDLLEKFEWGNH
jgi:hypothetical protein